MRRRRTKRAEGGEGSTHLADLCFHYVVNDGCDHLLPFLTLHALNAVNASLDCM